MPILPMSCSRPASASWSTMFSSRPISAPMAAASADTVSEWFAVDGSFASTKRTMFLAARRRATRSVSHSSSFAEWMRTTFGL